ncbi:MAG: ferredoxin [Myxococcota bacterium]|nr:ferredoxin [Myxococcota bacterium]
MRVHADVERCRGHGVCCRLAPEVFALDAGSGRVRVLAERPAPAQAEAVRSAVRRCPTFALEVDDPGSPAPAS